MRFWRKGAESGDPAGGRSARARLEAIDESTPHRYRFWLAQAGDRDAAVTVLGDPRRIPLTFEVVDEADGRVRFEVAAAGNGRGQSIISVLYSLQLADVAVHGFAALDVIEDLDAADLVRIVETWRKVANNGPTRSRIERLGGPRLLEMALERYLVSPTTQRPYGFAVQEIAFNTPGCEDRLLMAAAELVARPRGRGETVYDAESLLASALSRSGLSAYVGVPIVYPETALLAMVDEPSGVGTKALGMLGSLPAPLSEATVAALCRIAALDEDRHAAEALRSLRSAPPSAAVRAVTEGALTAPSNEIRATALWLLAYHWGTEARPVWREFLASKSTTLRDAAEGAIAEHGTEEDLPEAALRVAKIIRAKPGMTYSPPRASDLIDYMARYREHPVAGAAFADLAGRWDRFPDPGLRDWIREHHPWIEGAGQDGPPVDLDIDPEVPGEPDPPKVTRTDERVEVVFEDDASAHSAARERFEVLAEAHASVEVVASDREWLDLRIEDDAPEQLIETLWAQAVAEASRD
jgi:hypothetical protein